MFGRNKNEILELIKRVNRLEDKLKASNLNWKFNIGDHVLRGGNRFVITDKVYLRVYNDFYYLGIDQDGRECREFKNVVDDHGKLLKCS